MSMIKIVGIAVIIAGILGLIYGGLTYTSDTHAAKIGSLELSVKDKETVNIPIWASIGAIAVGGLLLAPWKKVRVA
jgi:TRAP-type C4-dicarboxylate transport system permease small subunit